MDQEAKLAALTSKMDQAISFLRDHRQDLLRIGEHGPSETYVPGGVDDERLIRIACATWGAVLPNGPVEVITTMSDRDHTKIGFVMEKVEEPWWRWRIGGVSIWWWLFMGLSFTVGTVILALDLWKVVD